MLGVVAVAAIAAAARNRTVTVVLVFADKSTAVQPLRGGTNLAQAQAEAAWYNVAAQQAAS